jgi:hypothetical protein
MDIVEVDKLLVDELRLKHWDYTLIFMLLVWGESMIFYSTSNPTIYQKMLKPSWNA